LEGVTRVANEGAEAAEVTVENRQSSGRRSSESRVQYILEQETDFHTRLHRYIRGLTRVNAARVPWKSASGKQQPPQRRQKTACSPEVKGAVILAAD